MRPLKHRHPDRSAYKAFWTKLHDRFVPEPRLPLAPFASPGSARDDLAAGLFEGHKFSPKLLAERMIAHFGPLAAVQGTIYRYMPEGVWQTLSEAELGRYATEQLKGDARSSRIRDAIQLLAWEVTRQPGDFVQRPGYINLRNGMLNIATQKLEPHHPSSHSRSQLPFDFDPRAQCPRWKRFLKEIFADDPAKARTLQEIFGYCLQTDLSLQLFFLFIGPGANGKGVVLSVLGELVGKDNRSAIALDRMDKNFILIELKDKLLNLSGEIETSRQLPASILKVLTGDDEITVDVKYGPHVSFKPTAKHVFAVNEMPRFADRTAAMRRRVFILEFRQKFSGKRRDPHLKDKLLAELPGILNWALRGARNVLKRGTIARPPSSKRIEAAFAETQNPVLAFVRRACRLDANSKRFKRSRLYVEYEVWHRQEIGNHPVSRATFYERLRADFPRVRLIRVRGTDYVKGIRLPSGGKGGKANA